MDFAASVQSEFERVNKKIDKAKMGGLGKKMSDGVGIGLQSPTRLASQVALASSSPAPP